MRAAVVEELNRPLVVRNVPDPECSPDGAIIRVGAKVSAGLIGICGQMTGRGEVSQSDLLLYSDTNSAERSRSWDAT